MKKNKSRLSRQKLYKSLTGINGLDDITFGGLPKNCTTLIVGEPGSGKTVMGIEYLVNGIVKFNEPGVFITFEETIDKLIRNVDSMGYNLKALIAKNKMHLEHIGIDKDDTTETGEYNIDGVFVRLEEAINKVKATRVVLDSLDTLFYSLDYRILRREFRKLFNWLNEKKVTAIITGEVGNNRLTRQGLEEYIADCVIQLDNRVKNQISTRRLRIVKYRGAVHGNSEYPFIIDEKGVTVFPIISEPLDQKTSSTIISSGISDLNEMLGKKGYYVGGSILVSGTAGTGKTSLAASFATSLCKEKKKCIYCAFEEAPSQVLRNMKSIGISLAPFIKSGQLHFYSSRPTLENLELHFISIKNMVKEIKPEGVILDPITNLMSEGPNSGVRLMLTRFVDFLKREQITVLFTAAITEKLIERNPSDEGISSMVDIWIMVQDAEINAERKGTISIMKTRGMSHSKKVQQLNISNKGIKFKPISEKEGKDRQNLKMQVKTLMS